MVKKVAHAKQGDLFHAQIVVPKSRAGRGQSAHSSVEASVTDVERRERRKVDLLWTDVRKKELRECRIRLRKQEKCGADGPLLNRLSGLKRC